MEPKLAIFFRFWGFLAQSGPTGLSKWILGGKKVCQGIVFCCVKLCSSIHFGKVVLNVGRGLPLPRIFTPTQIRYSSSSFGFPAQSIVEICSFFVGRAFFSVESSCSSIPMSFQSGGQCVGCAQLCSSMSASVCLGGFRVIHVDHCHRSLLSQFKGRLCLM